MAASIRSTSEKSAGATPKCLIATACTCEICELDKQLAHSHARPHQHQPLFHPQPPRHTHKPHHRDPNIKPLSPDRLPHLCEWCLHRTSHTISDPALAYNLPHLSCQHPAPLILRSFHYQHLTVKLHTRACQPSHPPNNQSYRPRPHGRLQCLPQPAHLVLIQPHHIPLPDTYCAWCRPGHQWWSL